MNGLSSSKSKKWWRLRKFLHPFDSFDFFDSRHKYAKTTYSFIENFKINIKNIFGKTTVNSRKFIKNWQSHLFSSVNFNK